MKWLFFDFGRLMGLLMLCGVLIVSIVLIVQWHNAESTARIGGVIFCAFFGFIGLMLLVHGEDGDDLGTGGFGG